MNFYSIFLILYIFDTVSTLQTDGDVLYLQRKHEYTYVYMTQAKSPYKIATRAALCCCGRHGENVPMPAASKQWLECTGAKGSGRSCLGWAKLRLRLCYISNNSNRLSGLTHLGIQFKACFFGEAFIRLDLILCPNVNYCSCLVCLFLFYSLVGVISQLGNVHCF